MEKKASVTIAKRRITTTGLKESLEGKFVDPVMRLFEVEQEKKDGETQQIDLDISYEEYCLLKPPFSMSIMVQLPMLDPYLEGAIDAVATTVSACDMEIAWTGEGDEKAKEREVLEAFFFESSDPKEPMSLQEKIKVCTADYIQLGSWNFELIQGGEKLIDLKHVPAEYIRLKKGMEGYTMIKNCKKVDFALYGDEKREKGTHQILRAINKKPGYRVYGKPLILSLVETVLMNSLRDQRNLDWFDQGALADLLIMLEETLGPDIKKQITADYQNTGDGTQTMYILDGVGKAVIEQLKRELEQGDSFKELEHDHRQRALTALRVPPAEVGIYEDANRANTITQDENFREKVIKPIQATFSSRFNHIIKHGFGYAKWEFLIKPISLKDRQEEAEVHEIYLDKAVESVNDVRKKLNMEKVKGGDRRVMNTPLGLVDLETWEIAVANPQAMKGSEERLANGEAAGLIFELVKLRKKLHEATEHEKDINEKSN